MRCACHLRDGSQRRAGTLAAHPVRRAGLVRGQAGDREAHEVITTGRFVGVGWRDSTAVSKSASNSPARIPALWPRGASCLDGLQLRSGRRYRITGYLRRIAHVAGVFLCLICRSGKLRDVPGRGCSTICDPSQCRT